MIKIANTNQYQVNDEVWWFDAWGKLQHGRIEEIHGSKAQIAHGRTGGAKTGADLSKCWSSRVACLEAEKQRTKRQVAEYKNEIKDAADLVRFLLDTKQAARERAKELGINIEE